VISPEKMSTLQLLRASERKDLPRPYLDALLAELAARIDHHVHAAEPDDGGTSAEDDHTVPPPRDTRRGASRRR